MLRATTLLILMGLAGGPISSLICELWCSSPAAEAHHRAVGCHNAFTTAGAGQEIVARGCCHDAVSIAPLPAEAKPTNSGPRTLPVLQLGVRTPDTHRVTAAWHVFQVTPAPGPSLHTVVLRI